MVDTKWDVLEFFVCESLVLPLGNLTNKQKNNKYRNIFLIYNFFERKNHATSLSLKKKKKKKRKK